MADANNADKIFFDRLTALAAFASLDFNEIGKDQSKLTRAMVYRMRTAERMTDERSLPVLIAGAIRLKATIQSIEFEESSQRFVITFVSATGNDQGKVEQIRSMRVDDYRAGGDFVRSLWDQDKVGKNVIIYKYNELPSESQRKNGGNVPPKGYRTAVYVELDRSRR